MFWRISIWVVVGLKRWNGWTQGYWRITNRRKGGKVLEIQMYEYHEGPESQNQGEQVKLAHICNYWSHSALHHNEDLIVARGQG